MKKSPNLGNNTHVPNFFISDPRAWAIALNIQQTPDRQTRRHHTKTIFFQKLENGYIRQQNRH